MKRDERRETRQERQERQEMRDKREKREKREDKRYDALYTLNVWSAAVPINKSAADRLNV